MNITYDKVADATYIKLTNTKIVKTTQVDESVYVDLDKKGEIVGIEVLDFSSNLHVLGNMPKTLAHLNAI